MSPDKSTPSTTTAPSSSTSLAPRPSISPSLNPANASSAHPNPRPPSISDLAEQLSESRVDHRPNALLDDLVAAVGEKWAPNATSREEEAREKEKVWRRRIANARRTKDLRGCMMGLQIEGGEEKDGVKNEERR
ncbi:hypothetical protein DPSP01_001960 [Paraphaeosphaeria sporulosa]